MNTITEIEAAMVKADKLFVSGSIRNDKALDKEAEILMDDAFNSLEENDLFDDATWTINNILEAYGYNDDLYCLPHHEGWD